VNLDLKTLYTATAANDVAQVESILERANDRLKRRFYETWSQSNAAVRFRTDGQVLEVLVREEPIGESDARFTTIAERSDGLRQFVALVAFTAVRSSEHVPILLLDEIETHLHYDAQADLAQMLAKQEIVAKVIYTTHSMGCLPEDLGTGVRFIQSKQPESFTSRIENAFWTSNDSGFSPLLFGMGASTLAFIPLRNAVIVEGPSDMILWPTLLREATSRPHLDFQVVPGLSKENRPGIIVLDRQAPRTAYLLDSDDGGRELHGELSSAGISEDKIFHIPDDGQRGLVIEDLIDPEIYVQAVNEEIHRSNGDTYSFPVGRLPATSRPAAVEEWCSENGINEPKKVAVAYRILEEGVEKSVLAETYREPIRQLFENISNVLQVNP
jgi:predicted ATP-dependent endonuclease of OLD family